MTPAGRWQLLPLVVFLFLVPSTPAADQGTRVVDVSVSVSNPGSSSWTGTLEARPADGAATALVWPVEVPGSVALELSADETWTVTARIDGLWFPEIPVPPGAGAVPLEGFRSSRFSAAVQTSDRGERLPDWLQIELRAGSTADRTADDDEVHVVRCPVERERARCEVPSGRFDLRVSAEGFAPVYEWEIDLPVGRERPRAAIVLRRGASIAGWVATTQPAERGAATTVRAVPQMAAGTTPTPVVRRRGQQQANEAELTDRGFFQLSGLEPGVYLIVATQPGVVEGRVGPVRLEARQELVLEHPIRLTPPATVNVEIDPPRPPMGGSWRVRLVRDDERGGAQLVLVGEGEADETGRWQRGGLPAGRYQLAVAAAGDALGTAEDVEVSAGGEHDLLVRVPVVEVEGTVRIGDEPLVAKLELRRPRDGGKAVFLTDEEGAFSGWLPREGAWEVEISPLTEVGRTEIDWPEEVEVRVPKGGRRARLDLELPDTTLEGRVVDRHGVSVRQARVTVRRGDATLYGQDVDDEGRFRARGLPAEAVAVGAESEEGVAIPVTVELVEGVTPPALELVIEERVEIAGTVTVGGVPSAGAYLRLRAGGEGQLRRFYGEQTVTDPAGRYQSAFLRRPLDLLVVPPAGPVVLRAIPEEVVARGTVDIEVAAQSGFIDIDAGAAGEQEVVAAARLELLHAGGSAQLQELLSRVPFEEVAPAILRLPHMEPGPYAFCQTWPGRPPACEEAYLQAGGGVLFTLTPPAGLRRDATPR